MNDYSYYEKLGFYILTSDIEFVKNTIEEISILANLRGYRVYFFKNSNESNFAKISFTKGNDKISLIMGCAYKSLKLNKLLLINNNDIKYYPNIMKALNKIKELL